MRKRAKVDANHGEIVRAARKLGASVQSLAAIGDGCPDLLIGFRQQTFLVEAKDGTKPPSQRVLTPDQRQWWDGWRGRPVVVVKSAKDLVQYLRWLTEESR